MLFFLLAACAPPETDGPDVRPYVDRVATRLAKGTDLCAYEDGEEGIVEVPEPDEGYLDDIQPELYQPCLDGLVSVQARVLDHPEGRIEDHTAFATFFAVDTAGYTWSQGEWIDPLDGTDDCGLAGYGPEGLMSDDELAWLDAGTVLAEGDWGSTEMTRQEGGFVLNYEADTSGIGAAASGGTYSFVVGGSAGSTSGDVTYGGFGAIDLVGVATLPPLLEVTSPPLGPGVELERADLPLEWTGTSDGEVSVNLEVEVEGAPWPWYSLRCTAADDGAFAIPAAILEAIPGPATGMLVVQRLDEGWIGTEAGRSIHTFASTTYEAWQLELP